MVESLPPAAAGTWDAALLAPIAEINEQMLEALRVLALAADGPLPRLSPRLVQATYAQWRRLDGAALRRLSSCPYLLLDAGFSQPARWQLGAPAGVMDQAGRDTYFRGAADIAMLRRTLLLAWHLARSNRLMASVALGMSPAVAECLARRRLRDLEVLAEVAPAWMVPRWEQQPIVWSQMIDAACDGRPAALKAVQVRGRQLLARERFAIC